MWCGVYTLHTYAQQTGFIVVLSSWIILRVACTVRDFWKNLLEILLHSIGQKITFQCYPQVMSVVLNKCHKKHCVTYGWSISICAKSHSMSIQWWNWNAIVSWPYSIFWPIYVLPSVWKKCYKVALNIPSSIQGIRSRSIPSPPNRYRFHFTFFVWSQNRWTFQFAPDQLFQTTSVYFWSIYNYSREPIQTKTRRRKNIQKYASMVDGSAARCLRHQPVTSDTICLICLVFRCVRANVPITTTGTAEEHLNGRH